MKRYLLLIFLLILSCFKNPINIEKYNVLLITLDTTRADCLDIYNPGTVKNPTIDKIVKDGILFK